MSYNLLTNISYCVEYVKDIQDILLYSHLVPAGVSLLLALFTYFKTKNRLAVLLVHITIYFSIWVTLSIIIWFFVANAPILMFAWSLIEIFSLLIFFSTFLFFYNYVHDSDLSLKYKYLLFLFIIPAIILSSSMYLNGFDAQECISIENESYTNYINFIKVLFTILIGGLLLKSSFSRKRFRTKTEIFILGVSLLVFLYTFFFSTYFAEHSGDYRYEMAGLFSFVVFIGSLTYLSTKYQTFQIKLVGAKVLVGVLIILSASQILFFSSAAGRAVDVFTVVLVTIFSYLLIQSIKKEIKQREELELLTSALEKANVRLKELDKAKSEFVSIASHQLRSPLTSIRGYASMLAEGSFGKMPQKAQDAAARIEESAKLMAMSVEDYLNVSRIESGNMKYNLTDFNLRDMTDKICEDLRPDAMKHNLILLFRTDLQSRGIVNADVGKTNQIIHNLINNSIKYTPKGTINVFMRDDLKKKKIYVDITDTGIGMSKETIGKLFNKFTRADNANSVNVSGTGLGLFVALKMAEQMGGSITAHSEGDGKGSTFTFELPLAM